MPLDLLLATLGIGAVASLIVAVRSRRTNVARHVFVLSLAWATVLSIYGANRNALVFGIGTVTGINLIAWFRSRSARRGSVAKAGSIALLIYMQLRAFVSGDHSVVLLGITVALLTLIPVISRLTEHDLRLMAKPWVALFLFHAAWAVAELLFEAPGIWPMADGSNAIESRPNSIFPELPGRPMTSFSHPIPLSFFFLTCLTYFTYLAIYARRRYFLIMVAVSLVMISLTGTRSALLVGVSVLVVGLSLTPGVKRIYSLIAATVVIVAIVVGMGGLSSVLSSVGVGGDFEDSVSYLHRSMILSSFSGLFKNDAAHVLFGWGTDIRWIFDHGIVSGYAPTFYFFDNQFVAMMAMYGAVGLATFSAILLTALLRGGPFGRLSTVSFLMMSFSFDTMTHFVSLFIFTMIAALPKIRTTLSEAPESIGQQAGPKLLRTDWLG